MTTSGIGSKGVLGTVQILLTLQELSSLTIPIEDLGGSFAGYYEEGALVGTITLGSAVFDASVGPSGIAVDGVYHQ